MEQGTGRVAPLLTAREADILELVALGLHDCEVAEALCIGRETVKTHVGNILSKLDARTRAQAVAKWTELGGTGRRPENPPNGG